MLAGFEFITPAQADLKFVIFLPEPPKMLRLQMCVTALSLKALDSIWTPLVTKNLGREEGEQRINYDCTLELRHCVLVTLTASLNKVL